MEFNKNTILAMSLERIVQKIKNNQIEEELLNKIYCILFEGYHSCFVEDKVDKDIINYTFLGWWICENLKCDNNIPDINKNEQ